MFPHVSLLLLLSIASQCLASLYHVLDVQEDASRAQIRNAYRKLAKEWHPDKNKSPEAHEKFLEITEAYEVLSDLYKRIQYDRSEKIKMSRPRSRRRENVSQNFGILGGWFVPILVIFLWHWCLRVREEETDDDDDLPQLNQSNFKLLTKATRLLIVVIVTDKKELKPILQRFRQAMKSFQRESKFGFCWIAGYKNRRWVDMITSKTKTILNGNVIAINRKRNYFSHFSILDEARGAEEERSTVEDTFSFESNSANRNSYANRLCGWLEQLLDGSLTRHIIDEWPILE